MTQLVLQALVALTSVWGGIQLIVNGAGLSVELLAGSPFPSYVIPGLILGIVVGGTHAIAFWTTLRRIRAFLEWGAVAGFGLLIWLFVELYILNTSHLLHLIFFGIGVLELVLVMLRLKRRSREEVFA